MPWKQVKIVVDTNVRGLCTRPYPNHRKGCPNFNEREDCPPKAPLIATMLDLNKPIYAIYNIYDFAAHVARMRAKHPMWSKRQLECCLYWQPTARKALKHEIKKFMASHPGLQAIHTPEAMGVNVTATMENVGIKLEWPPVNVAYQVVMAGSLAKLI